MLPDDFAFALVFAAYSLLKDANDAFCDRAAILEDKADKLGEEVAQLKAIVLALGLLNKTAPVGEEPSADTASAALATGAVNEELALVMPVVVESKPTSPADDDTAADTTLVAADFASTSSPSRKRVRTESNSSAVETAADETLADETVAIDTHKRARLLADSSSEVKQLLAETEPELSPNSVR